jgi:hypothetical protein
MGDSLFGALLVRMSFLDYKRLAYNKKVRTRDDF